MGTAMFDQFKQMLRQSLQDPDFRRKNAIFQDDAYLQNVLDRVDALTSDVSVSQNFSDVISVLGMLEQDNSTSTIRFDTRGFTTTLSAFREGLLQAPKKIWRRTVDGSDERYLVSDRDEGVLVLNSDVEMLHRFPNYGPDLVSGEYDDSNACCTFTLNGVEYIAITMFSHHICHLYEYNSPNTFVSSIGVMDTPGDIANYLNNPVGVAVDEENAVIYLASLEGQPAGATLSNGYVSAYDITDPTTPTFIGFVAFHDNTGSLLDVEVTHPKDLFFESGLLWISNGNNEVGAIATAGGTYRCMKYIEATGAGYALNDPQQVIVYTALGGFKKIYVANGAAGLIEEFDYRRLTHLNSYGYRALEDELNLLNRMSSSVYGAIAFAQGVMVDRVYLNGEETDVMICADPLNKRIHRFNLNAYTTDNFVNFGMLEFDVPVSISSWTISGTVPPDMIKVFYRFAETEDFRELTQNASNVPSTTSVQFRLSVELDSRRFVRNWYIKELVIHGKQS